MDIQDACDVYEAQLELAGMKRNCADMGGRLRRSIRRIWRGARDRPCADDPRWIFQDSGGRFLEPFSVKL